MWIIAFIVSVGGRRFKQRPGHPLCVQHPRRQHPTSWRIARANALGPALLYQHQCTSAHCSAPPAHRAYTTRAADGCREVRAALQLVRKRPRPLRRRPPRHLPDGPRRHDPLGNVTRAAVRVLSPPRCRAAHAPRFIRRAHCLDAGFLRSHRLPPEPRPPKPPHASERRVQFARAQLQPGGRTVVVAVVRGPRPMLRRAGAQLARLLYHLDNVPRGERRCLLHQRT